MPTFAYRIATASGRTVRGVEDAASPAELERSLSARGFFPLDVAPAASAERRRGPAFRGRRADVVEVVRYLATLLDAGFPLDRALGAVERIAARTEVAAALRSVRERVRAGGRLADALAEHPRIFPGLAVGMASAGERGGHLAEALGRLAGQLEREHALRSRMLSAMTYPMVLALAGIAASLVLLLYVLPRFVALLGEAGAEVPRSTALLLGGIEIARSWGPAFFIAIAVAVAALSSTSRSAAGRRALYRLLLRLPVVGPLRRRLASARFGHSLATLLGGGMPMLPALDIAAGGLGDDAAAEQVRGAREEVRGGARLTVALRRCGVFPHLFLQMVDVGEEGGRLPELLERGAAALEQDLERRLERLVRLAEPALILVLGGVIGFIALALLQAMYGMRMDGF